MAKYKCKVCGYIHEGSIYKKKGEVVERTHGFCE